MTVHRIYVDTEILKDSSKSYLTRRNVFDQVGKSIQSVIQTVIDHMPDYDGRMQPAARNDAMDFYTRCQQFSKGFEEDSDYLLRTADAFEKVDGQTVKIIGDCQDLTSKACFIDQGGDPNLWIDPGKVINPDGSVTTFTSEVIVNPDGSRSTVITERTAFPDGSVKEIKTIRTEKVIDSETADQWNQNTEDAKLYMSMAVCIALGTSAGLLAEIGLLSIGAAEGVALAADLIVDGTVEIGTERLIEAIDGAEPDRGWESGDTITNTITVETTYAPDGTPLQQEVTNTTVVTNNEGEILSSETTGVDPTGALKSGTPPIDR